MKKAKKLLTIAAAAFVSVFGFGQTTKAATMPITSPNEVNICQTFVAPYGDTSDSYEISYRVVSGTNMTGSGEFSITGSSGASSCFALELGNFSFVDDSDYYTGTVTVAPTAIPSGLTNTGATSYVLHFVIQNSTDEEGNINGKEARLAYITKSNSEEKQDDIMFEYTKDSATLTPSHIVVSKSVQGAVANVNDTFNFTVYVGGQEGATYVIKNDATGATSSCAAETDCTFSIKNGQTVTIGLNGSTEQIPAGTVYTITENGATDYETYINGDISASKSTDEQTINVDVAKNTFDFLNVKDGDVSTGIVVNILPYVLLAGISLGLIIYSKKTIAR